MLFLEDVAERPYRIDRMLTHLRLAGKLERVAAVVLGSFADCDGPRRDDVAAEVFRDFFADAPFPVVAGFPAGHRSENLPLALGLPVRVDARRRLRGGARGVSFARGRASDGRGGRARRVSRASSCS